MDTAYGTCYTRRWRRPRPHVRGCSPGAGADADEYKYKRSGGHASEGSAAAAQGLPPSSQAGAARGFRLCASPPPNAMPLSLCVRPALALVFVVSRVGWPTIAPLPRNSKATHERRGCAARGPYRIQCTNHTQQNI